MVKMPNLSNIIKDAFNRLIQIVLKPFICPISIFTHANVCFTHYGYDILLYFIHILLVWLICFPIIYFNIIIAWIITIPFFLMSPAAKQIRQYKLDTLIFWLTPYHVSPTRDQTAYFIENINVIFGNKYIFYRTPDDMDTCYCAPGIRNLLDPYRNFSDFKDSSQSGSFLQGPFIIPLLVMGLIYLSYLGLISASNTILPKVKLT